jgi:hypothetical protein
VFLYSLSSLFLLLFPISSVPSFFPSLCVWFSPSLCFFSLILLPCSLVQLAVTICIF